jgi:CO/xanthine dehydrogenase Mo-binding subunit
MIGHGKRHAVILRAKWGATKDGKLVAVENEIIGDGGAYMYTSNKVLGNSAITSTGPYAIPNVKTDVYGVYTNNLPGCSLPRIWRTASFVHGRKPDEQDR